MQDEELFIGGYIIRRDDDGDFLIESTFSEKSICLTEKQLTKKLAGLWEEVEK